MKQFIRDWLFGFRFLLHILIACLCMGAGFSLVLSLDYILGTSGVRVPFPVFLIIQILYFIVFCPYFLASYVRYFGLFPSKQERVV